MISKTFRLFISSTFSDFSKEREVLQTSVFPKIRGYASSKGYTFQPIDLRWGVSNEAQLDQKTLELCLEEVRSCKIYPHPNFLIMIGDRYGWVPLPYAIEENEFEQIRAFIEKKAYHDHLKLKYGKALSCLNRWYTLDKNNQPASYILKERTGYSKNYEVWGKHEIFLRTILQESVGYIKISEVDKRKYFLSATEAEVEEGIIPYLNTTDYQKELIKKDKALKTIDPEHIFGFLRDIEKDTKKDDMFIVDNEDYLKAQTFKQNVKKELDNILELKTSQKEKKLLDESYLERFKEKAISFLVNQIDEQIKKEDEQKKLIVEQFDDEEKDRLFKLQVERKAQKHFAKQKRKNFIKTTDLKELRTKLCTYIYGDTSKPMVIHGPSGSGKSAFMANTIKLVETLTRFDNKKLIYRFVGATPYTSNSREMLLSIFDELSINMRSEADKQIDITERTLNHLDKNETFEEFSDRTYDEIMKIDEEVVLFIDAVDQLTNTDQFRWLPSKLPLNVKIIISALEDNSYKKESEYFKDLQKKQLYKLAIQQFNEPVLLLKALLKRDRRTIQKDQVTYFQKQFKMAGSPLYVSIAAEEIKHWKSNDYVENNSENKIGRKQSLASTQKGIIKEFIENLSKVYHHDERFVHKVLGYLYASKDGLSESELLQLISTDEVFIKQMAPEIWHNNTTKELPLVLWTRLYSQLKPFLSIKKYHGEELLYFFHREFEDVVSKSEVEYQKTIFSQQDEHKAIIKSNQKLISKYKGKSFNSNRWGRLYIILNTQYNLVYSTNDMELKFIDFIINLDQSNWVEDFLNTFLDIAQIYFSRSRFKFSKINVELLYLIVTHTKNNRQLYGDTCNLLVALYTQENNNKTIDILNEAIQFLNCRRIKEYSDNTTSCISLKLQLAKFYQVSGSNFDAIKILKELYHIKHIDQDYEIYESLLMLLGYSYSLNIKTYGKAIKMYQERLTVIKLSHVEEPFKSMSLSGALLDMATILRKYKKVDKYKIKALEKESLGLSQKVYFQNRINIHGYTDILNNLARTYAELFNSPKKAIILYCKALNILKSEYEKNKLFWLTDYYVVQTNLAELYMDINQEETAFTLLIEGLEILKEHDILLSEKININKLKSIKLLIDLSLSKVKINKKYTVKYFQQEEEATAKLLFEMNPKKWGHLFLKIKSTKINKFMEEKKFEQAYDLSNELLILSQNTDLVEEEKYIVEQHYCSVLLDFRTYQQKSDEKLFNLEDGYKEVIQKCQEFYNNGNDKVAKEYVIALDNYTTGFLIGTERIHYDKKTYLISQSMYVKYPKIWKNDYIRSLENYIATLKKVNKNRNEIHNLEKKLNNILKKGIKTRHILKNNGG